MSRQSCRPRSFGSISAQLLHWSPDVNAEQVAAITEGGSRLFDVIIASDCLFFREFHSDLVQTLRSLLSPGGVCLFLQPKRSCTMQTFVDKCEEYFHCEIIEDYSAKVTTILYLLHPLVYRFHSFLIQLRVDLSIATRIPISTCWFRL